MNAILKCVYVLEEGVYHDSLKRFECIVPILTAYFLIVPKLRRFDASQDLDLA